jgi:septal ring factor EnvC (AmiA/AmiB activator)
MLQLVVQAKLSFAQAKEQVDTLKRDNARLGALVSDVKGQLANAKAAHEDMEAACAHALADRAASLRELDALRGPTGRTKSFFARS